MIQVKICDERVTNIYYGETLIEGFIRIDSIPSPEEIPGKIPVMYYRNGEIVYEYEPIPEMPVEEEHLIPEMTYEEQVVAKIRERYSINDELALLRQKDTKTAEFQAYYQYVEECKSNIKANYNIENGNNNFRN